MARRCLSVVWLLFALALALASCEELRHEDEATCTGYGFHPGTDAYWAASPSPYWGWGYC